MRKSLFISLITAVTIVGAGIGTAAYLATRSNDNQQSAISSTTSESQIPTSEPTRSQQQITERNCISDTCLQVPNLNYPVASVSQNVKDALSKTLDNEYKLQAYYQAVIAKFGDKRPFSMIIGAETQHIAVITSLDEKYGVTPVANQWNSQSFSLNTFSDSCQTSASYERSTVNLLNELLPQVTNYSDITQVLTNIRDASLNNHLPAFEQCS